MLHWKVSRSFFCMKFFERKIHSFDVIIWSIFQEFYLKSVKFNEYHLQRTFVYASVVQLSDNRMVTNETSSFAIVSNRSICNKKDLICSELQFPRSDDKIHILTWSGPSSEHSHVEHRIMEITPSTIVIIWKQYDSNGPIRLDFNGCTLCMNASTQRLGHGTVLLDLDRSWCVFIGRSTLLEFGLTEQMSETIRSERTNETKILIFEYCVWLKKTSTLVPFEGPVFSSILTMFSTSQPIDNEFLSPWNSTKRFCVQKCNSIESHSGKLSYQQPDTLPDSRVNSLFEYKKSREVNSDCSSIDQHNELNQNGVYRMESDRCLRTQILLFNDGAFESFSFMQQRICSSILFMEFLSNRLQFLISSYSLRPVVFWTSSHWTEFEGIERIDLDVVLNN